MQKEEDEKMVLVFDVKKYMLEHKVSRKQAYKDMLVPKKLQLSEKRFEEICQQMTEIKDDEKQILQ